LTFNDLLLSIKLRAYMRSQQDVIPDAILQQIGDRSNVTIPRLLTTIAENQGPHASEDTNGEGT